MADKFRKKEEQHEHLKALFEEYEMNSRDARSLALRDRDYYDNKQWSSEEIEILNKRKQPVVTINRIKPKIDSLLGIEQQNRVDPKILARTPEHERDAAVVTDILQYIDHRNNFDDIKSKAFEDMAISGVGACKIVPFALKDKDGDVKDFDINIKQLHYDRIFWDPHSRQANFSDARFRGEVIFMDADQAKALFPGKEDVIDAAFLDEGFDAMDSFHDKPRVKWADKRRQRLRVVEIWYKKGHEIFSAIFTRGGFVQDPTRTPYRNDMGMDEDPYCFRSAYCDREGNRYGYVRQLISIQDEINKRRSKALHMMSVRQTRFSRNSELDTGKVRKELARPDGIIRAEADELEILPTNDMAQAQFALLADAQAQIDVVGTSMGSSEGIGTRTSAKSVQARNAAGSFEVNTLFDGMRMFQREVFKKAWGRVREFWTEEKYIRVTDDNESAKYILINREDNHFDVAKDREDIVQMDFPIAELDVDIIIREGINDQLAKQEQFIELSRMAASGVPIPMEVLLELSSIRPNLRDKVLKKMEEQQMAAAQAQQAQAQLQMQNMAAEIQNTQANAAKKAAEAEGTQLDNLIKQIKPIEDA